MEGLAPPLELALSVRSSIECGDSVRTAVLKFISQTQSEFGKDVATWLGKVEQGGSTMELTKGLNPYRRALLDTLAIGLRGQSILNTLKELEKEIADAAQIELDRYIALLPIKLMVPLLLFQFPAYLIILLGPMVKHLLGALQ